MFILTDEEIIFIENTTASRSYNDHARAIEAAVLNKLAEQAGEPDFRLAFHVRSSLRGMLPIVFFMLTGLLCLTTLPADFTRISEFAHAAGGLIFIVWLVLLIVLVSRDICARGNEY